MNPPGTMAIDLAKAYKETFSTPAGKRVLADLLADFPPDRPPFSCNGAWSSDPVAAAFRSGQSTVTKQIVDAMQAGDIIPKPTP